MTPHQKAAATRLGIPAAEYAARIDAGQKWCTTCRQWKQLSDFQRNVSAWDGRQRQCGPCKAALLRRQRAGGAA
mgnify:CR=1 FL=1